MHGPCSNNQGDCITYANKVVTCLCGNPNVRIISYSKLCNGYDTNDTGNSVKCVSDRKMYRYAST